VGFDFIKEVRMDIWQFLFLLLIIIINGWLIYYFTYFKKSGEYQAIKENIDEVTTAVESIKGEVEYLTTGKIGLATEIRTTILSFQDKLALLIYYTTNYQVTSFSEESINDNINIISLRHEEFEIALNRLKFIIDNLDQHRTAFIELQEKLLAAQDITQKFILEIGQHWLVNRAALSAAELTAWNDTHSDMIQKYSADVLPVYGEIVDAKNNVDEILRATLKTTYEGAD
jgi:hypothetical protein